MISFLAFIAAATFLGFVLYGQVLSHLRREHAATWSALGRPSLTPQSIFGNRPALQRFLWSREFASLADPGLTRKCEIFRWFMILYAFAFPVAVLAISR